MIYSTSKRITTTGFTLVEILIVVAITGTLAAISIAQINNRILQPDVTVDTSGLHLISTLSLARSYAFSGHICCGQTVPPTGYGVYIPLESATDNTSYLLYADYDGDLQYTTGGVDEVLETRYLESQVVFTSCYDASISIVPEPNNYCDISFVVDPDTNTHRLHGAANSLGSGWIDNYITIGIESIDDSTYNDDITIYGQTFVVL